ncbi:MAG: nuclease [Rhodopirellula sp.]|nr:nuclease [Rhodopirellula sp.]
MDFARRLPLASQDHSQPFAFVQRSHRTRDRSTSPFSPIEAMRFTALLVLVFSCVSFATPPKITEQLTGKVVRVTDGDTVTVLVNLKPLKVRLYGIDAPETKQSFGNQSKAALAAMVFGKVITVKKTGTDKYGRTLGIIRYGNTDVNAKMIEDGWAWHYKYYNDEDRLAKLETKAKKDKLGLWADSQPLAPWEFRRQPRTPTISKKTIQGPTTGYWLNLSSGVRHNSQCGNYKNTKRGRPCGPNEGRPCGICKG